MLGLQVWKRVGKVTLIRSRTKDVAPGGPQKRKCGVGHELTPENCYRRKDGSSYRCRICSARNEKLRRLLGPPPLLEKTCAREKCGKKFESRIAKKKYCNPGCEWRQTRTNYRRNHPGKDARATKRWRKNHPGYCAAKMREKRAAWLEKHSIPYDKWLVVRKYIPAGAAISFRREAQENGRNHG